MEFIKHVRKPFFVEAVKITNENIAEVAEFVGKLKEKPNGEPYIQVDRRKVPNVYRVYPGFWMTRMQDHIRCYASRVFDDQFTESNKEIEEWVAYVNSDEEDESESDSVAAEE